MATFEREQLQASSDAMGAIGYWSETIGGNALRSALAGEPRGNGMSLAVACSRFNSVITNRLLRGTLKALDDNGVSGSDITVAWVPGAFELPLAASKLAASGDYDAVICLGAVIRGGTGHYEFVAGQCAAGILRAQLDTGVPVVFGVLTCDTVEQALERSGGGGIEDPGDDTTMNKGFEAAISALEMADLLRSIPTLHRAGATGTGAGT